MDLRRLLVIVRARLLIIGACVVLGAALAYVASINMVKVYEANATLLVGGSLSSANPDLNQILVAQRLSQTYAHIATTGPNLQAVVTDLDLATDPSELAKSVRAEAALDSSLLTITAQSSNATEAAAIANALALQLIASAPDVGNSQVELRRSIESSMESTRLQLETTQAEIDRLTALPSRTPEEDVQLTTLTGRLATLQSTFASLVASLPAFEPTELRLIDPALPPSNPVSPRILLNTLLGAMLGLLLGLGLVLAKDRLDDTLKTPEAAEAALGLPAIGIISQMPGGRGRSEIYRLTALLYPRSPTTERYRTLRTNIEFATADNPVRTLLITSSLPGEGKTVTSANLGAVFAQAGRRVLLVDTDLRRPGLHKLFDAPNTHGLTSLLRGSDVDPARLVRATEQADLWLLPSGPLPADPAELIRSSRTQEAIASLARDYDLVILDSPPVQSVADAALLSSYADATLLVVGAGKANRRAAELAHDALERAGANLLGVVLNLLRDPAAVAYGGHYPSYPEDVAARDESLPGGPETVRPPETPTT